VLLVSAALGVVCNGSAVAQWSMPDDTLAWRSRTYDVVHYKLTLAFEEEERRVLGTTAITLTPLRPSLDSMVLDAVALTVDAVTLPGGQNLPFSTGPTTLTIRFPDSRSYGDTFTVSIRYSCTPTKGLYFVRPDSTGPKRHRQIWTQGEDMDNRFWFPCYDYPNDKATSEVIATVKDSYVLVSNGALVGVVDSRAEGTHTFHWRQTKPHASYLIMVAAGDYTVLHDAYRGIPLLYYVYKDQVDDARETFRKTTAIMDFFEQTIGFPYPWEKLALIILDDFMWGGMENTSAITLNAVTILDARARLDFSSNSDDMLSHEIAHQWWGDLVTFRDWRDLWLSEGFADFFEAEFKAHDKGKDELQYDLMEASRRIIRTEERLGRKAIVSNDSYTTNVYAKGRWVLHMMREMMGEELFRRGLRSYLEKYSFRSADSHEFRLAMEDATGWNLDWFFKQWVYKAGHPELEVSRSWDGEGKNLTLLVRQTQACDSLGGLFAFPLDIECSTRGGKSVLRVWVDKAEQSITIPLAGKPAMVIVDKGQKVLKSLVMERSAEELVYQLSNAEDVNDRVDAARALRDFKDEEQVFEALSHAALRDRFWGVRREASISLGVMNDHRKQQTLFTIYSDPDSRVRNAAVTALESVGGSKTAKFLQRVAEMDSSYLVVASSLHGVWAVDSARGIELALRYVDSDSYRQIIRKACLTVLEHTTDPRALACGIRYVAPGYPSEIREKALRIVSALGREDSTARVVLPRLLGDPDPLIRSGAATGLGVWGESESLMLLRRRLETETDPDVQKFLRNALHMNKNHPPD
jgi:aminopeptidase N